MSVLIIELVSLKKYIKERCYEGGTAPPTPKSSKLACFVFYLKIINIFLKNNICIL